MVPSLRSNSVDRSLRRVVLAVALLNLAYFGVEFALARMVGSVALFADSIDFLEDASVNFLVLIALHWSVANRARVGKLLAILLFVPAFATAWTLWSKLHAFESPSAWFLGWTGAGAFLVNATCAFMLARFRKSAGSLMRAAFLSARNDVIANIAIVLAAAITAWTDSAWPDVMVGIGIAILNADAAKQVWRTACDEQRAR